MSEENNQNTANNTAEQDYVKIIDDLKAKQREELNKEKGKYAELLKAYTEGKAEEEDKTESAPDPKEVKAKFEQNIKDLNKHELSNLDNAKKLLEVRNYVLENEKKDIFLPSDGTPSNEDVESAKRCAELLQDCVDNCQDDPNVFTSLFHSHIANKF